MEEPSSAHRMHARAKINESAKEVAAIFRHIQDDYGLDSFGVYYGQAASLCAFNLLDCLGEAGIAETIQTMIVVLSTVAWRWTLVRGILKVMWHTMLERKLESHVVTATEVLLKLNAVDTWGAEDHRLFEMCAYPNYAAIGEKGRDFVEIGDLLQEYASLKLGDDDDDDNKKAKSHDPEKGTTTEKPE